MRTSTMRTLSPPDLKLTRVTAILEAAADEALPREALVERLVPILYDELREIARAQRRRVDVRGFQTTALVHEAYLKMAGRPLVPDRAYVFAAVAQAMREVLVDHARRRGALKRGGGLAALSLSGVGDVSDPESLDALAAGVLDVDAALRQLDAIAPRAAALVECRFFGGLTIEASADALGISVRTAKREWRRARAWLHRALSEPDASAPTLARGPENPPAAEEGTPAPPPDAA